ncbi:MAG: GNAT family N-acetyltransferase [Pseudonocardiaceae bacterium]|nr:GNAT family N-acetyltransferase [Pseudonocardiaceae bacterium]
MRRSKAYWGYDLEFLERVRELLSIGPEQIQDDRVIVAERDGVLLGVYQLSGEPPEAELTDLFIEPAAIGSGVGRTLWEHAVCAARARGFRSVLLESDPNAEGFYVRMGAERVGELPVAPGRALPLMRLTIAEY